MVLIPWYISISSFLASHSHGQKKHQQRVPSIDSPRSLADSGVQQRKGTQAKACTVDMLLRLGKPQPRSGKDLEDIDSDPLYRIQHHKRSLTLYRRETGGIIPLSQLSPSIPHRNISLTLASLYCSHRLVNNGTFPTH